MEIEEPPLLIALRARAGQALDNLSWSAARRAVDAVRYRPRRLPLLTACAARQPEVPPPIARWLTDSPMLSAVDRASAVLHPVFRTVALEAARWVGPTASSFVRWVGGAFVDAVDRMGAATIERPLSSRAHPGLLVPHLHTVGILAVDMRGFSHMTRVLGDSQYLVVLIEEYLSVLTRVVEQHRGVVFQYTGDGLLALFLPEFAGVDDAEVLDRLVYVMTPKLHHAFDVMYERWRSEWAARGWDPVEIGLGVGVSFGEATVGFMGPIGKKQVGVLGEPVNLAAFLCSQARAGTVLVDLDSFTRVGAVPPSEQIVRLRSKKRHQRIRTVCLEFGTRPPSRSAGKRAGAVWFPDLRWGWPPFEMS